LQNFRIEIVSESVEKGRKSQRVGVLIDLHRWREALTELGSILAEEPGNYNALCQKALCHFSLREYQVGYDTTKTAIESGPEFEWAYRIQSHIFSANGETNRALEAARICVEKAPYFFETQQTLFYALLNYGLLDDAKATLETLLNLWPDSVESHAARGYYALTVREFDTAETAFLEALKLEPNEAKVLNNLGAVYHEMFKSGRGRKYKRSSIEMFERAVKAKPTFKLAQKNIGQLKGKQVISGRKAGIFAVLVVLLSAPLQAVLYAGFSSHEPLNIAFKEQFSPFRGDEYVVLLNSCFIFVVMIWVYSWVRYLMANDKQPYRERLSDPAALKLFLFYNLGMIAIYCLALYEANVEANWFPGIAIRVFALGALFAAAHLVNLRHSKSPE
jgi:Tfp pilus assembly protein PilF